jgi:hypothetical protein
MYQMETGKVRQLLDFRFSYLNRGPVGYNAPENLQNYATYLNARIRAYRDLKHDVIRVQSESNRDLRNSNAIEEDNSRGRRKGRGSGDKSAPSTHTRSKTIMGRKLRVMTVEKGLLRETKIVQRMIDALVECRVIPCHFFDLSPSRKAKLRHISSSTWEIWRTNSSSPR